MFTFEIELSMMIMFTFEIELSMMITSTFEIELSMMIMFIFRSLMIMFTLEIGSLMMIMFTFEMEISVDDHVHICIIIDKIMFTFGHRSMTTPSEFEVDSNFKTFKRSYMDDKIFYATLSQTHAMLLILCFNHHRHPHQRLSTLFP